VGTEAKAAYPHPLGGIALLLVPAHYPKGVARPASLLRVEARYAAVSFS